MNERVGDEKLIIISVAVRGINDHIRLYSQMFCTAAISTSNFVRYLCQLVFVAILWVTLLEIRNVYYSAVSLSFKYALSIS